MNPSLALPIRAQNGFVLLIALLALVLTSLAAVALVRSVDTGTLVAGNLALKKSATHAGDKAIDEARKWLLVNAGGNALYTHHALGAQGYWAVTQSSIDLFGDNDAIADYDWNAASTCAVNAALTGVSNCPPDGEGNRMAWVIHRLCRAEGNPIVVECVRPPAAKAPGQNQGAGSYSTQSLTIASKTVYLVTVRVNGPRNSVSYLQSSVY